MPLNNIIAVGMPKKVHVLLLFFCLSLLYTSVSAQKDTIKLRVGETRFLILNPGRPANPDPKQPYRWNNLVWVGIDVGLCGWVSMPGFKPQPQGAYDFMETTIPRSWRVGLNVWEAKFRLNRKRTVNIMTGMGIDWYNYSFERKIILRETDDLGPINPGDPIFTDVNTGTKNILRSRLQASYVTLPLMLNFRTRRTWEHKKQVNITIGAVGSVRIGSNARHVYTQDGDRIRELRRDDFLLRRFRVDAELRVRWYIISAFGRVGLTESFRKGPGLYPWTAGLHLQIF